MIKIQNLSKQYENEDVVTKVLSNISFNIDKGEFVAIMGPSGSGKSTLMHILGFLDRPSAGKYSFDDKDVSDLTDDELAEYRSKKIGFVFQAFNLLPRTSVFDNVKMPLAYTKEKNYDEKVKKAIAAVGLEHRLEYSPSQLSGGEKQRVAIARALINNPDIIFADEPTGNLDSKSGAQVMAIFKKLNEEGHTVILVTHEKETASYARRVICLKDGMLMVDEKQDGHRVVCDTGVAKEIYGKEK